MFALRSGREELANRRLRTRRWNDQRR